jgi:hypothetical protein
MVPRLLLVPPVVVSGVSLSRPFCMCCDKSLLLGAGLHISCHDGSDWDICALPRRPQKQLVSIRTTYHCILCCRARLLAMISSMIPRDKHERVCGCTGSIRRWHRCWRGGANAHARHEVSTVCLGAATTHAGACLTPRVQHAGEHRPRDVAGSCCIPYSVTTTCQGWCGRSLVVDCWQLRASYASDSLVRPESVTYRSASIHMAY